MLQQPLPFVADIQPADVADLENLMKPTACVFCALFAFVPLRNLGGDLFYADVENVPDQHSAHIMHRTKQHHKKCFAKKGKSKKGNDWSENFWANHVA